LERRPPNLSLDRAKTADELGHQRIAPVLLAFSLSSSLAPPVANMCSPESEGRRNEGHNAAEDTADQAA
jgi:hypothetical protein